MKIKTIFILAVIVISVFLIYFITIDKEIYYVNLTDKQTGYSVLYRDYLDKNNKLEKYIDQFNLEDYRITDFICMIEDNKEIKINSKKQTIKNALIKADLITFSIGMNDIQYKIGKSNISDLYDYVDEMLKDMKLLFSLIRQYSKEEIVFIGLYNTNDNIYNEVFNYMNDKIDALCNSYQIIYIDVQSIVGSGKKITEIEDEQIFLKLKEKLKF